MPLTDLPDVMVLHRKSTINIKAVHYFMIQLKKYTCILIISILPVLVMGQNIFDPEHSRKYANYLLQSRQFNLAVMELERLSFIHSESLEVKKDLLYAYTKAGKYKQGISRMKTGIRIFSPVQSIQRRNVISKCFSGNV